MMPEDTQDPQRSYLTGGRGPEGSGYAGNLDRWERARRPVIEAIHRDGDFLTWGARTGCSCAV